MHQPAERIGRCMGTKKITVLQQLNEFEGISENSWYPYFSSGQWSLHQLIEKLSRIIGPSSVTIVSFTVSEEALRFLRNMSESGMILEHLTLLVDTSAFRHKRDLMLFACKIPLARIYHHHIHSKLVIMKNDVWNITVVTSANLSPNYRMESGIICTRRDISDAYLKTIEDLIQTAIELKFDERAEPGYTPES